MKTTKIIKQAARGALAVGVAGSLASCGGSSDGGGGPVGSSTGTTALNVPPASASESVDGFIAFMKGVVATTPDAGNQLDVTAFVAPTSDTTEPDPSI